MSWKITLILIAGFFANQSFAITNGQFLKEVDSPQIVLLKTPEGTCTGVVVGRQTVLTAMHCVPLAGVKFMNVNGRDALDILVPEVDSRSTMLDLALVKVDPTNTPEVYPIHNTSLPLMPIRISIMGYGDTYLPGLPLQIDSSEVKRIGFNILGIEKSARNESYYNILSEVGPYDSQKVSGSLPGDSGGPMILEGKVIGIASKSLFGRSSYTNLSGNAAKIFFSHAQKLGWDLWFQ